MAAREMEPVTRITDDQLLSLADAASPPCISIYLPTHKSGRDTQGDATMLKNLLREAEGEIENSKTLKPARELVEDPDFWVRSSEGLAIFLAEGFLRIHRLPVAPEAKVTVGERFYIRPLLNLLRGESFHVLVLSQNDAKLLECSPNHVAQIELPKDVATSLSEAVGGPKDHHVDRAMWRNGGGTRAQASATDVHGHGPDQDNEMIENLHFYMRQLDDGVRRAIGEQTHLLVAGAESTAPIYLQDSKHRNLIRETIHGNFEHARPEEVRDRALEIIRAYWEKEADHLGERFGTALAHGLASDQVEEVIAASKEGRVDTLIVSQDGQRGDGSDHQIDKVDDAVHETLRTKGAVVVLDRDSMPGKGELAAIYRY